MTNDLKGTACVPQKPSMHLALDEAISYLEQTASAVSGLISEITDSPQEASACPDKESPSLTETLNGGPTKIMDQCDRIRGSLAEIRNLIF